MGIIKNTIRDQVNENNRQYFEPSSGTIISYDKVNNVAGIQFVNPYGGGYIRRENVPVSQTLGGVVSNGIQPGQKCSLTFVNGNVYAPVITGILSSTYYQKTNKDQGAYLVDNNILTIDTQISDIIPMTSQWIDYDNNTSNKYVNQISPYDTFDLVAKHFRIMSDIHNYSDTEQGMTHLDTKSTVKLKDNGDIDIFVANNVGIRISKRMKKIYFYGFDVNINGEMDLLAILRKCRDCEFEGYRDETQKNAMHDLIEEHIGYIEGNIEELKKCVAYTKDITGDIDYFSTLDTSITKFEALKKDYNEGRYSDSLEDLQDAYEQIMSYYQHFEDELILARERWGLS